MADREASTFGTPSLQVKVKNNRLVYRYTTDGLRYFEQDKLDKVPQPWRQHLVDLMKDHKLSVEYHTTWDELK